MASMNAKKQISLEQLFRLYPQLRPDACSESNGEGRPQAAAEGERGHVMTASAAMANCTREV
jgi:hypothetical protein